MLALWEVLEFQNKSAAPGVPPFINADFVNDLQQALRDTQEEANSLGLASYEIRNTIMSGGGTISYGVVFNRLKWTTRFLLMPQPEESSSSNFINLTMPTSGVTNAAGTEVANADGILLESYNSLWAVHTRGLSSATGITWKVLEYTDALLETYFNDPNAYLIAARNAESNTVTLRNGLTIRQGEATGTGGVPLETVSADRGDANVTLTPLDSPYQRFDTTLTANRTVTMPTIRYTGMPFFFRRTAGGAFTLSLGGVINLAQNEWAHLVWDGSSWRVFKFGSLNPAVMNAADKTKLDGIEAGARVSMPASEILTSLKTVDGAGSLLDADLFDGLESTDFLRSNAMIPTALIPSYAISEPFTVASQAAMLALAAGPGDLAIRTDFEPDRVYILSGSNPAVLANWVRVTFGDVVSVQGSGTNTPQTGVVILSAADVGAAPSSHVGAGGAAHANAIAGGAAGFMTGADKTKLDGLGGSTAFTARVTLLELSTTVTLTGATSGYVKVPVDTATNDTHTEAITASNRIRPKLAGWYDVRGAVNFTNTTLDQRYMMAIYKNGASVRVIDTDQAAYASAVMVSGGVTVYCNGTTDYIELFAQTSSGTNPSATGASYLEAVFAGA